MKYKVKQEEFNTLKEMGYHVHMFMPWHYRVFSRDFSEQIDIYPTRKTFVYHEHKKEKYEDLLEIIEKKLDTFI